MPLGRQVNNRSALQPKFKETRDEDGNHSLSDKAGVKKLAAQPKEVEDAAYRHHKKVNNPTLVKGGGDTLVYEEYRKNYYLAYDYVGRAVFTFSNGASAQVENLLEQAYDGVIQSGKDPVNNDNFYQWKRWLQDELLSLGLTWDVQFTVPGGTEVEYTEENRQLPFFVPGHTGPKSAGIARVQFTKDKYGPKEDAKSPISSAQFNDFIEKKIEETQDIEDVKVLEEVEPGLAEEVAETDIYEEGDRAVVTDEEAIRNSLSGDRTTPVGYAIGVQQDKLIEQDAIEVQAKAIEVYGDGSGTFTAEMANSVLALQLDFKTYSSDRKQAILQYLEDESTPPNYVDQAFEEVPPFDESTAGKECETDRTAAPKEATPDYKSEKATGKMPATTIANNSISEDGTNNEDLNGLTDESNDNINNVIEQDDTAAKLKQEEIEASEAAIVAKDKEVASKETDAAENSPEAASEDEEVVEEEEDPFKDYIDLDPSYAADVEILIDAHNDGGVFNPEPETMYGDYLGKEIEAFGDEEWWDTPGNGTYYIKYVNGDMSTNYPTPTWDVLESLANHYEGEVGTRHKYPKKVHSFICEAVARNRQGVTTFTPFGGGASESILNPIHPRRAKQETIDTSKSPEEIVETSDEQKVADATDSVIKGDGFELKISPKKAGVHKVNVQVSNVSSVETNLVIDDSVDPIRTITEYKIPKGTKLEELTEILDSVYIDATVVNGEDVEDVEFVGAAEA